MVRSKHPNPRRSIRAEEAARERTRREHSSPPSGRTDAVKSGPAPQKASRKIDDYQSLAKALIAQGPDFAKAVVKQVIETSMVHAEKLDTDKALFGLSVIKEQKPRDQLDTMQLVQMTEIHAAFVEVTKRFRSADNLAAFDSFGRMMNQFARTYTAQLEAFDRRRAGGESKFTVQTVSVADGGQAIVGNVTQAMPEPRSAESPPAAPALADARQTPMQILTEPERVPVASGLKSSKEPL